ncbi:hypothetical protein [Streptomyces sp. PR69]|uniref:hypothetical protein n=1 Tax=Streptomyces sp. PR69 TaxID=2984950 RepID=UPI002264BA3A|nr:hypothetical protein [Streptomyces sp. PR69]
MGSRLYVEVLDYAPTTLTHREKLALAVLADDARDSTRITWSSVESEKILRRAQVSRPQIYEVIKALVKKGVLEKVTAGQKNGTAKYRILPLQCPELPDTGPEPQRPDSADTGSPQCPETPDPGPELEGPETPDTEPPQRPQNPDTDPTVQCPRNPDTDESQCPEIPDVSVRKSRTPTHSPLSTRPHSYTDPPSSAGPHDDALHDNVIDADVEHETETETQEPDHVTAQTIVGEWLQRTTKRPPRSVIGQMAKQIHVLLEEDRIDPDDIRRGIARWMQKGLHPSTLPAVVNEVMNTPGPGSVSTPPPGQPGGTVFDRARARAAARAAQRQEGQTP